MTEHTPETMAARIKELEAQRDALVETVEALLDPEYCQTLMGRDDADDSVCYSVQKQARAALAMVGKNTTKGEKIMDAYANLSDTELEVRCNHYRRMFRVYGKCFNPYEFEMARRMTTKTNAANEKLSPAPIEKKGGE